MTTIYIATRNQHKVGEIKLLLPVTFVVRGLPEFAATLRIVEDAGTFAGNAAKKAEVTAAWLAQHSSVESGEPAWVLADDSGLEVDALQGAPGVNSARFAAADGQHNSSDAANNARLLEMLATIPDAQRTARFRCVIALTPLIAPGATNSSTPARWDDQACCTRFFEGACEGCIARSPTGLGGFGYDPLFVPLGQNQSFAELGQETKNQISHRARALTKVQAFLADHSIPKAGHATA